MPERPTVHNPPHYVAAGRILGRVMQFWDQQINYRFEDLSGITSAGGVDRPVIYACWHQNIITLPAAWNRSCGSHRRAKVLTSTSRYGALLSRAIGSYDIGAIRGSTARRENSQKRGGLAMREMLTCLKKHRTDICITPDGPKGPLHTVNPGVIQLARLTGAPIQPVAIKFDSSLRLPTWDRMFVPAFRATATTTYPPLIKIPRDVSDTGIADYCDKVRDALLAHQ